MIMTGVEEVQLIYFCKLSFPPRCRMLVTAGEHLVSSSKSLINVVRVKFQHFRIELRQTDHVAAQKKVTEQWVCYVFANSIDYSFGNKLNRF